MKTLRTLSLAMAAVSPILLERFNEDLPLSELEWDLEEPLADYLDDSENHIVVHMDSCLAYGEALGIDDEDQIVESIKEHLRAALPKDFPFKFRTEDDFILN